MTEIWKLSAVDLAARIRRGEVSAVEAARANIERMHAANPGLNAVVTDLSDSALARARQLDETFAASGPVGPLHGVPVTIKINSDQQGEASSNGVPAYAKLIAPEDAPPARLLQNAGAVVIGRSNAPEYSFRADTINPQFGRTNNPWDAGISPGGSSGGAAAAVMAGIGHLAHGNDILGSLRFPAAACGAVTVKPSANRVPAWNSSAASERGILAVQMAVQGVIARTTGDVRLGMETLIGPDPRDPWHIPLPFAGPALDGPARVALMADGFGDDVDPEVLAALDTAAQALRDAGHVVEEAQLPLVRECGTDAFRTLMGEVFMLQMAEIRRNGSKELNEIFDRYFEVFPPFKGDELIAAMARRTRYAREMSVFMQRYPLVLSPLMLRPTFRAERDAEGMEGVEEVLGSGFYSFIANFTGLPAGNVPARLAGGLPIGVQVLGQRFREDLILDACAAIEARVGSMAERLFEREAQKAGS